MIQPVSYTHLDVYKRQDLVIIGPYPWPLKRRVLGEFGHMSNEAAGNLIKKVIKKGTEIVLLGHLSKENNFPELAYKTVESILLEDSIDVNPGICLDLTYRDKSSKVYEISVSYTHLDVYKRQHIDR